jgi:hypothetical protein
MTDVLARQQQERQRIIAQQQIAAQQTQSATQQTGTNQPQIDEFLKKYVQLDNGEYVERDKFNSLDSESQRILKTKGVDSYNTYKAQQAEAEFAKANVKLSDGNWVTKESFDSLPNEWQGELSRRGIEGYKKWWESKPYGNATTYYVMDGRVYVPSENPNIGIDSTGMRVWLGDRWPEHAIKYSGRATDVNTATLIAQGKTLVPADVTLPSLIPDKKQETKQDEAVKVISPEVTISAQIEKKPELTVQAKETIKVLDDKYKEGDTYNLSNYLRDNPEDISKLVAAGFSNEDISNAITLKSVQKDIADIKAKQKKYDDLPLTEKIATILGTKISSEDFLKETLSFGGAKTKAFDQDQIELEYLEAKQEALQSGADLNVSKKEYVNEVLQKQGTAAELGMQFVPFEYARPERWQELQTWEKVVYPALDVITLIPVIGLAGKAAGAGIKAVSTGAKLASLGGKQAVEFAAKDAVTQLTKAGEKRAAQQALYNKAVSMAEKATDKTTKNVLKKAVTAAEKDLQIVNKEYNQIAKNAEMLASMNQKAAEVISKSGATAYKAVTAVERVGTKAGLKTEAIGNILQSGAVSKVTVENWNDLNPAQRAAGIAMAILPTGIAGKTLNVVENVADPYKVPLSALKERAVSHKVQAGKLFSEKGGTTRLVLDERIGTAEQGRQAVASLIRQVVEEGKSTAKAQYGTKEIKYRATGLQKVTGKTVTSATPMGEIFKEGTGAFGKKTNLEKYLEGINEKLPADKKIIIKAGEISTETAPGVGVTGKEGGQYFAPSFAYKFSEKAAFGATGKIRAGVLTSVGDIKKLPENVAKRKIEDMGKAAIKTFDGAKHTNQMVEGFKQYRDFMEFENVLTNGSRELRAKNLRSNLADRLKLNRGEYYTRDPKGRIELFQMYIDGGRTTPYTLKELYQLKGNALKNSLEDIFIGLGNKLDELRSGKPKTPSITKEEQINGAFNKLDDAQRRGLLKPDEVSNAKREIMEQFRKNEIPVSKREMVRQQIQTEYSRNYSQGKERIVPLDRIATERRETTREVPRDSVRIVGREPVRELPRETIREQPRPETRELPREDIRQQPRDSIRQIPRETPREIPREQPREQPREIPRETPRERPDTDTEKITTTIPIIGKGGEIKYLTDPQRNGLVAWKQGFIYIAIYPPYDEPQTLYSREPIEGVKYEKDVGSAARSLISKGGKIPDHIYKDMGIVDITISRTKNEVKPEITYRLDRMQRTTYSGKNKTAGIKAVR